MRRRVSVTTADAATSQPAPQAAAIIRQIREQSANASSLIKPNLIDFFAMCGKISYKDSIGKSLGNDKSVGGLL